ncbi:alpha-mannosidase [Peribacillus loiseleuriae]|uniref:Glycosyl hydrolase n=1 Tax=Peribacillus loiseleuriae TaxID=1679170 RepID=A0A0K9GSV1_9BACI|nr:glycoside hydrolase family 38 C-terminal domain-containing protein [Peribacillus loiseleuriae]KMY49718.1 glycosyl hydrolase [Peribacillus loiseleuriae]
MVKAHIVNHTHWDREWYFTSADALVLSEQLFTEVIDELIDHPEANFVLDGQMSILDDYVNLYPEKLSDIKQLVEEKRLFIGPWYTQTDAFFTQGESVLRNAMIGIFDSKRFGQYMPIGYLPDTFGFNAQMPTLLRQAGFDNIVFWRGIHLGKHVQSTYFKWRGLGGEKEVYAINMPQGYGTGMLLEPTSAYVDGRLDPAIDFIEKHSNTEEVLIPSGNDQLNIIHDFSSKLKTINEMGKHQYEISTYTTFLEYIKSLDNLEIYQGEFREPVLARVHKTIGSSRMNIKLANDRLEQILLKRVEPLMVIAQENGIFISVRLLMQTWKKVLEGQAHDSLAGCVSDTVADDILHRMKEAEEMAASIENTIVKKIADGLRLTDQEIIVFNTELHPFIGFKDIQVVTKDKNIYFPGYPNVTVLEEKYIESRENILQETSAGNIFIEESGYFILKVRIEIQLPGLGYKVISFSKCEEPLEQMRQKNCVSIENAFYKILFENQDVVLVKPNGEKVPSFIQLENISNAGDTYDFSPLPNDKPRFLSFEHAYAETSNTTECLILEGKFKLPLELEDRQKETNYGYLKAKLFITLQKANELIECRLEVDNQIFSHRLRIHVKSGIHTNFNIASLPFGYIKRENQCRKNWSETYIEMPVDIEPLVQNVSITSSNECCTVFTKGIKEYQHVQDTIAITLLATTGQLGKPDLLYRPGRASGDTTKKGHVLIPTPKAQLIGKHEFMFAVFVGDIEFNEHETAVRNSQYIYANIDYQLQAYNYFLHRIDNKIQKSEKNLKVSKEFEMLKLPEEYLVTACHPSFYDKNKFLIRIQNPTSNPIRLDEIYFNGRNPEIVNAIEEVQYNEKYIIPAYDVLSIRLSIK